MRVCALDVETTGLDSSRAELLAIAAIADEWPPRADAPSVRDLPTFYRLVRPHPDGHLSYAEPAALVMNTGRLADIAKGGGVEPHRACLDLVGWLRAQYGPADGNVVLAGKNLWKLDLPVLLRIQTFRDAAMQYFHYRVLEPTAFYTAPDDAVPPSLSTCLARSRGSDRYSPCTAHDPVDDCRAVLECLRAARPYTKETT